MLRFYDHRSFRFVLVCHPLQPGTTLRKSLRPPLLNLLLTNLPQLIHAWRLASCNTLRELDHTTNCRAPRDGILRRHGLDFDEHDTWVLWATVMLAIAQVAHPRLQAGRVVLLDGFAISDNVGSTADRCPFTTGGEEAQVDIGVRLKIVGLTRF
jgi:hypothetical protein